MLQPDLLCFQSPAVLGGLVLGAAPAPEPNPGGLPAAAFFCIWGGAAVALLALAVWALVDVVRRRDLGAGGKAAWIVAIVLLPVMGAAAYLVLGKMAAKSPPRWRSPVRASDAPAEPVHQARKVNPDPDAQTEPTRGVPPGTGARVSPGGARPGAGGPGVGDLGVGGSGAGKDGGGAAGPRVDEPLRGDVERPPIEPGGDEGDVDGRPRGDGGGPPRA